MTMDLTPLFMQRRSWKFSRTDGSIITEKIHLIPDGRIIGSSNKSESTWRIKENILEFLDHNLNITTRFDTCDVDEKGIYFFKGKYLGSEALNVTHVLTDLSDSSISAIRPRVAVLVRTHLVNEKLFDLLKILKKGVGYDLFICADETNGPLQLDGEAVISHSINMCREIGLYSELKDFSVLWYFGDYAFYCVNSIIPDYDYYTMIEYDVEFTRKNSLALEGLLARITNLNEKPYDLVSTYYGPRGSDWVWTDTCSKQFEDVYGIFFPLVIMSKRALCFLYELRRKEISTFGKGQQPVFCEAFVPSALIAAGDFRCGDVGNLIPGSWEQSTFRVGTPMLLGQPPSTSLAVEFLHPVFSENSYLIRLFQDASKAGKMESFLEIISNKELLKLSSSLRLRFMDEARRNMLSSK